MTLFERLLEQCLGDDLTETPFWAEGVYRALEQDRVQIPVRAQAKARCTCAGVHMERHSTCNFSDPGTVSRKAHVQ